MTVTLYLARHGETRLNSEDKLRGWLDVPLNSEGIKEAEAMGVAMAATDVDRIYCSDLDRADHTAQIIAKHHSLTPIPRQWFRPLNYGEMNGKSLAEIQPELERLNQIWKTDPEYEAPGGESFSEFQYRNLGGLHAILKNASDGEQIMVVAHLRNCLLFHGVAINEGPLEGEAVQMMDGKRWRQSSGSISQFRWDPEQQGDVLRYVGMHFAPPGDEKTPPPEEGSAALNETALEERPMIMQGGEMP
jgi:2,3-bisphosphoglycerate-dependent phosphoglycerate mutase